MRTVAGDVDCISGAAPERRYLCTSRERGVRTNKNESRVTIMARIGTLTRMRVRVRVNYAVHICGLGSVPQNHQFWGRSEPTRKIFRGPCKIGEQEYGTGCTAARLETANAPPKIYGRHLMSTAAPSLMRARIHFQKSSLDDEGEWPRARVSSREQKTGLGLTLF